MCDMEWLLCPIFLFFFTNTLPFLFTYRVKAVKTVHCESNGALRENCSLRHKPPTGRPGGPRHCSHYFLFVFCREKEEDLERRFALLNQDLRSILAVEGKYSKKHLTVAHTHAHTRMVGLRYGTFQME